MNEEQVLNALSCLTNGALNYYQTPQTVLVRDELIRDYITNLQKQNTELKDNWNKLKEWLEEEKIRLARECSNIYEDDLGKTKLVNEDIYNELNNVLDKMQEIERWNNDTK